MGGNYLYICMYIYLYVCICMYVCMYTMILPLHFSVPIYRPWQKKKKKKKTHSKNKKRRWALARARIYVCLSLYISSLTSQHVYIGAGTSHRSARSLNCDNFGQEQYFLMR